MENAKLPARVMIANYCPWHYRGLGCRYGQRGNMKGPIALSKQGASYFWKRMRRNLRRMAARYGG